jgi:hypothetical protein
MPYRIMCGYGNCNELIQTGPQFKLTISESRNGICNERQSFCCYEHGILWLQKRDELINRGIRQWRGPVERGGDY